MLQQHANSKKGSVEKLCIGQVRAGSRRKTPDPINQTINQPSDKSQEIPRRTKIEMEKIKPSTFQRANTFNKGCKWKDDRK